MKENKFNDTAIISHKIKELRQYLGMSLKMFGAPLGYTDTSIKRFECNKWPCKQVEPGENHPVILKICTIYGVKEEYFHSDMKVEEAVQKPDANAPGRRAKKIRIEKGYGLMELNSLLGFSNGYLGKIESGKIPLTKKTAEKLSELLGVGVGWLLYGAEEEKKYPLTAELEKWIKSNEDLRKELWERYRKEAA